MSEPQKPGTTGSYTAIAFDTGRILGINKAAETVLELQAGYPIFSAEFDVLEIALAEIRKLHS